jgi:uncharacterized protein (DUF58 family)
MPTFARRSLEWSRFKGAAIDLSTCTPDNDPKRSLEYLMPADKAASFSIFDWGVSPGLLLILALVPLVLLMLLRKTYPAPRMALLMAIPFLLTLPLPWLPIAWWYMVLFADILFVIAAIVDLLTVPAIDQIHVARQMARVASLDCPHLVEITIDNRSTLPLKIKIAEDQADRLEVIPAIHDLMLMPGKRTIIQHTITAHRRGAFVLENLYGQLFSRGRLWQRQHVFPCRSELHVYPDIKQLAEYALLARTNRLSQIGVRRTRRPGQESDFERLRDYQQDDNYRHIDWRSTARRQKMTVRQFQTDQSQRVIFMLDCGRMMTNEYEQRSLLDYALNSVLMLSYVALDQGDSVGMLCFSDHIHRYVPPAGGKRQMNRILHAGFDQFPRLVQSRFDQAFLYLSSHCRRRSLVVLITNVIDQVNSQQIHNYMGNLVGAHLPLIVLLRDRSVFQSADNPYPDPAVLYRSAAASQLLIWRHQVIHRMKAAGSLTLDVFPDEMTSPLINQYLEVKARHLL